MKKILLVSRNYAPHCSARSIRLLYIVKHLLHWGCNVDVLASAPAEEDASMQSIMDTVHNEQNVSIHRTSLNTYLRLYNRLRTTAAASGLGYRNTDVSTFTRLKTVKQVVRGMLPSPDGLWKRPALRLGRRLLDAGKYDLIYSSAKPVVSHIVSYELSRYAGVPLVLEYGDPWVLERFFENHDNQNCGMAEHERRIIEHAKSVVLTTEETQRFYERRYPQEEGKYVTVYSGYDPELYGNGVGTGQSDITIAHIGRVYSDRNDFGPLMASMLELRERGVQLNLEFTGSINTPVRVPESLHCSQVRHTGPVTFGESIERMRRASILLLCGWKGGLQVPMKTFWYLGANRPILVLLGDDDDPLKKLLAGYKRVIIAENRKESISEGLTYLCEAFRRGDLDREFDLDKSYEEFTWERQLIALSRVFGIGEAAR